MPLPSPLRSSLGRVAVVVVTAGLLVVPVGAVTSPASATACPPLIPCIVPPGAAAPVVTGVRKVGETVTASEPAWDQSGVTTTYQWLRDGEEIAGATMRTYTLTADDFGAMVVVRGEGSNSLGIPGTTPDSAPVEAAKGDPITPTSQPVVTGSGVVGEPLTTTDGTWSDPDTTFDYQWYRSKPSGTGAQVIPGATTATYTPVVADAGRTIVALVVGEVIGYEKGFGISNPTTVPRTTSATSLTLLKRTVRASESARVRVTLRSGAGLVPTGVVGIFDGTVRLRTFRFAQPADGVATFAIKRLARGTHRLTARYVGDNAHAGSASSVQVLTVTR